MELHSDKDVPRAAAQFGNGNDLLNYVLRDFYLQYMCSVWFNHRGKKNTILNVWLCTTKDLLAFMILQFLYTVYDLFNIYYFYLL